MLLAPLLCLVSSVAAPAAAAISPPVDVTLAPGVVCPTVAAIRRSLGRAPAPEPARAGAPAAAGPSPPATWLLRVGRAGGTLSVVLDGPEGRRALSRTLPLPSSAPSTVPSPGECDSTADAIALMVDRYFRDLVPPVDLNSSDATVAASATAIATSPAPMTAPPPGAARSEPAADAGTPKTTTATTATATTTTTTATAATTATASVSGSPVTTAAAVFTPPPRWRLAAGMAYWTRLSTPAIELDVAMRLWGPLVVGAATLLPPLRDDRALDSGSGQAHLWGIPARVRMAVEGRRRRIGVGAGVEGLVTLEHAESRAIVDTATSTRIVAAAGVRIGASIGLGSRLQLDVDAAGYRSVLGRSYQVDGVSGLILEPPAWQAIVGLRLGWVISP